MNSCLSTSMVFLCAAFMSPQISQKIRNLSFFLMALICFIHGYNLNLKGWQSSPPYWIAFLETFISDGICRSAVPFFFIVSGFLAAQSTPEYLNFSYYFNLIRKKFQTLLAPYLIVSLCGILFVIGLQLIPFADSFFSTYRIDKLGLNDWVRIWLVSPIPFPLWFIRFLFIYFLFFPLIYWGTKYLKLVYIFFTLYLWVSFRLQSELHIAKIQAEGLFFFSLGLFLGIEKVDLNLKMSRIACFGLLFFWITWIAFRSDHFLHFPFDHAQNHYHLIGFTLIGVFAFWSCFDHFPEWITKGNWVSRNAPFTIGIFLFHEPVLTIFKKVLVRLGGGSESSYLISYFFAPILALSFALYFSKLFSSRLPKLYQIFTGNRQPRQPT